ncbi:hypothetical protein Syn7803US13_168 [Synechococcus phage ACG-2014f]|jgi:hypothetical protein|uniref:Uncharacterized protein n=3 Tax=Atlauavirus TaxID=2733092 RepID=A0A0E3IAG2_9CAUD|nr:hypothetical protein AAJ63_gp180 [Synechococcus phage ACG-2014f]YP_009778617.1 hypothetical protein HOQ62_gp177 [Synechococcus phage ACG-2014f_Syn7803C8]YP_009778895.1 hypothetical protein HOQ63_gp168 [Synechococcus phage ACG-2014f_Syn7803US26]AIX16697.1 hypothetical protein Syn7803C58_172 [Synechococcus phage ACG-2014f]AIX20353.1 hypothetical protein Syn7803C80_176 [Synechococcus phage ACG-2014f]AIX21501.1 hypothetical protein Syn7803C8_177 [Synechococcus phage ACG-2014f_Syn7803C8]AIX2179
MIASDTHNEPTELIRQINDSVERARMKEQDDQLNYDTGGK